MLTFGSLFSGIGGIDLGLQRAGMTCKWQCEIDEYAQKVLQKHWPNVARFRDIRDCGKHNLSAVDVIAGGFPCQDISPAGRRAGIDGGRSGLWSEYYRIICELRPRYVLVENSADLLKRGMGRVLGDLARVGYDAEWRVLSAAQFGARHLRRRTFIVAYTNGYQYDATSQSPIGVTSGPKTSPEWIHSPLSNTDGNGLQTRNAQSELLHWETKSGLEVKSTAIHSPIFRRPNTKWDIWASEPNVDRVADGVPNRVQRIKGLGNAVVPQVAEYVGRCIVAHSIDIS
jgi:DNA (cytosine-5)-methyltransferase 1